MLNMEVGEKEEIWIEEGKIGKEDEGENEQKLRGIRIDKKK